MDLEKVIGNVWKWDDDLELKVLSRRWNIRIVNIIVKKFLYEKSKDEDYYHQVIEEIEFVDHFLDQCCLKIDYRELNVILCYDLDLRIKNFDLGVKNLNELECLMWDKMNFKIFRMIWKKFGLDEMSWNNDYIRCSELKVGKYLYYGDGCEVNKFEFDFMNCEKKEVLFLLNVVGCDYSFLDGMYDVGYLIKCMGKNEYGGEMLYFAFKIGVVNFDEYLYFMVMICYENLLCDDESNKLVRFIRKCVRYIECDYDKVIKNIKLEMLKVYEDKCRIIDNM